MYVSHFLEKEASMYPGSKGSDHTPQAAQNILSTAQCPDFTGYLSHNLPSLENHGPSLGCWGGCYGLHGEDWGACSLPGPSSISTMSMTPGQIHRWPSGQVSFASADYNSFNPADSVAFSVNPEPTPPPHSQRLGSYEWMKKSVSLSCRGTGKTRTKEKYRVVYTDQQRLELEKEFHSNRYITLRRKSELAAYLGLSERQIKIWFQNRRAKERKLIKKKISQFDGNGGSAQSGSSSASPAELPASLFSTPHTMHGLQPLEILQIMATD